MSADYFTVNISADSLGWTRHWLKAKRCDLLTVAIAQHPKAEPRVRITAVESKSDTSDEPIEISEDHEPFTEALIRWSPPWTRSLRSSI